MSKMAMSPAPGYVAAREPMADVAVEPKKESGETWKRSTITPNSSRVMVGDREQLTLRSMQTKVTIDGFRARVVIDYLYANDLDRQLEGNFQIRLPDDASPFFFAFGETAYAARAPQVATMTIATSGDDDPRQLMLQRAQSWQSPKEARMVPRETAQVAYDMTVRKRVDPALVEWAGAGVFSARVYPLQPRRLHRIVVGYDVDLVRIGDDLEYRYDLPAGVPASIVDLAVPNGTAATTTPATNTIASAGRQIFHFEGTRDQTITLRVAHAGAPLLVGTDPAGTFFATQATPALPREAAGNSDSALFLVDTSLSANPDRFNVSLKLLRAILDNNRGSLKRFNVVFFSVDAHWYRSMWVDNTPENVDALIAYSNTMALEGATDLGAALGEVTKVARDAPDVFLLSDGAATWGEGNVHALGRILRASNATLFAYQTGLAGTDVATLAHLTRESGGAVFSVTGESELAKASTAHRARPWRLVDVKLAGASDVMLAGRPLAIYPGQTVMAVGRGPVVPGAVLELVVEQAGRRHTTRAQLSDPLPSQLAARAYGQVATNRIEELEASAAPIAKAYATHFRITGRTCSLLMLESEADYARFNIRPTDDVRVVDTMPAAELFAKEMSRLDATLGDPKTRFLDQLARLEQLPTVKLQTTRDYRALLDALPASAFVVDSVPLATQLHAKTALSPKLLAMLAKHDLDYDLVSAEAAKRRAQSMADELKALSSLVENNPGDAVLARDVGYSAMDLGLRAQAYHLFRRVAEARPHEPQTYRAIAQALVAMGKPELAVAYFEIPLAGHWDLRFGDLRKIVILDYVRLLRRLSDGKPGELRAYAQKRLGQLGHEVGTDRADVVVTITWNTDNTDVDLHVIEPSGEECMYSHRETHSGGRLTQDVTRGYGPEMYVLKNAPKGNYNVFAHYYAQDRNRASTRTKVYVTMIENYGTPGERVSERVVALETGKELHPIATLTRLPATTVAR